MTFLKLKFVNRKEELETLHRLATKGSPLVEFIYGPEGCGKTRLLKEFIKKFNGVTIYIDTLERELIERALIVTPPIEVKKLVGELMSRGIAPIGTILANSIFKVIQKIITKIKLEDKHLVIAVDDVVKAIGLDKIEWYVKWLYESIYKIYEDYKPRSILIIATTSEGESLERVWRHTYTSVRLIWNLPYEAFHELAQQLNPPSDKIVEKAWKLIAGNPRRLIELAVKYNWSISSWIQPIREYLEHVLQKIREQNLTVELKQVLENPDNIYHLASPKMHKLQQILVEENLILYKHCTTITGKHIQANLELGIGKYYAWQIPAYKQILKELLQA